MPTSERVTATVRAEDLPADLAARFRTPPIPGTRYIITAEPVEESEDERLASLRAEVAEGLADLAAGRTVDGDDVFREISEYLTISISRGSKDRRIL